MPRGDNTGPAGKGPMTGRNLGYCNGNAEAGFESAGRGGGFGMGRGRRGRGGGGGRGRGQGFGWCGGRGADWGPERDPFDRPARFAPPGQKEQLEALKRRAEDVSRTLDALQAEIRALEPGESETK